MALAADLLRQSANPRILFCGMASRYSGVCLERLIRSGEHVTALVMPAEEQRDAPGVTSLHILAQAHNIPLFRVRTTRDAAVTEQLRTIGPDLAIVAGFPFRISPEWLGIPAGGFLNVHPSLLPAHRGPTPLFWTLRAGETESGVTLHFMDENFDTGDIVYQAAVTLTIGDSGLAHTVCLAEAGAGLACRAARHYAESGALPRRPQPPSGSYESFPGVEDFRISADWPAERAFHFMRGAAGGMLPYTLLLGSMLRLEAREALSYEAEGRLAAPYIRDGDSILVQFAPGVLRVRS